MIKIIEIGAIRKNGKNRKSWVCPSGKMGTVEELVQEYYMRERAFAGCFIDSACVYGGLLWALFHDVLFHDNLNERQPLCKQYLYQPQRFYKRHKDAIEQRLEEYRCNRGDIFDRQLQKFLNHPFFCDPRSKIFKYSGSWLIRNHSELRDFVTHSIEHYQEDLIREMIVNSHMGLNAGWPDLVAWNSKSLIFSEVKSSTDKLNSNQISWIENHEEKYQIELVRVLDSSQLSP
jgi:hypothetical protein